MTSTTFSFEIFNQSESKKIKTILEALGVSNLVVKKRKIMEEYVTPELENRIEEANKEYFDRKTTKVDVNNLWESIL